MNRKVISTLFLLIGIVLFASCKSGQVSPTPEPNMPNPASVYCEENGGKLEIRTDASGGQVGICVFPDGSECDEWAYFRGECKPGENPGQTDSSPEVASDGWLIYSNESLGYSFHYPADATIMVNDDPLKSLSIVGPLVEDEYWPQMTISHPQDREEFRPPEDADLLQWLTDHNLLGEDRMEDVQIAGTTAIHFRHERSPQSYAFDLYYFARFGQLYSIVISHAGDKEDWELYNHFLQSIQFEQ
jgi:putative hemolysin